MRCRVRARGLSSPSLPTLLGLSVTTAGITLFLPCRHRSAKGQREREKERTNKSTRFLRRDIVSCKVNHLGCLKMASSPCCNHLSTSLAKPRGNVCYPRMSILHCTLFRASSLLLSFFSTLFVSYLVSFVSSPSSRLPHGQSS